MKFLATTLALGAAALANAECPLADGITNVANIAKLTELAGKFVPPNDADLTKLKVCGFKGAIGVIEPSDFCADGPCAAITKIVETTLGIGGPDGKKFADCTLLKPGGLGASLDTLFRAKTTVCGVSNKLDAACFLATLDYSVLNGLTFNDQKCSVGLKQYACAMNEDRCGVLPATECSGAQTLALIEGNIDAMLTECGKAAAPSDACKAAVKDAVATLRIVAKKFKDAMAADVPADKVKAAKMAKCMFDAIERIKAKLKTQLDALGKDAAAKMQMAIQMGTKLALGSNILPSDGDTDDDKLNRLGFQLQLFLKVTASGGIETMATEVKDFSGVTDVQITEADNSVSAKLSAAETADAAEASAAFGTTPSLVAAAALALVAMA